jgi:hypothetical protein
LRLGEFLMTELYVFKVMDGNLFRGNGLHRIRSGTSRLGQPLVIVLGGGVPVSPIGMIA